MVRGATDDVAVVCRNGHLVNPLREYHPEDNAKFCAQCGAPTISACEKCSTEIRGGWHSGRVGFSSHLWKRPAFCGECGNSFPWTEAQLEAARDLAHDQANLSAQERDDLEKAIPELVRETPQATVAAGRFKRLMTKAGKEATEGFRHILTDVLSEAVKKIIFP